MQAISINIYKIDHLTRIISNCPTESVPTFPRAEFSNLRICACLCFPSDVQHNQIREPDSHNILDSNLQIRIQSVDKILCAERALAHLLTLSKLVTWLRRKIAIIYFLWTRKQKGDIKGTSRIRQSWTYAKEHLSQHIVNKVLCFSHGFFLCSP